MSTVKPKVKGEIFQLTYVLSHSQHDCIYIYNISTFVTEVT